MTEINMVEALNQALRTEMKNNEDVLILGEDVGEDGGVFRVTDGLHDTFGDTRVIDTPLSESGIVGTALGMAMYGLRPVTEIQFMGFSYPAFDQIISHISRMRNRTRGNHTAPMVIRMPYGGGIKAPEHHSESTEAIYAHIPGLKVVTPSNPSDAYGMLRSAIQDPDPVLFLEPKKIYRAVTEEQPNDSHTIPLGNATIVEDGTEVTLISWGAMVHTAKKAAEELSDIDVEIIDLRSMTPLDMETVEASVKKTGRVVIVHEAPQTCGFGAELSARITEDDILHLKSPIKRVTGFDTVFPLYKLEDEYIPGEKRIKNAITSVYDF